jgi:hypothetical protein
MIQANMYIGLGARGRIENYGHIVNTIICHRYRCNLFSVCCNNECEHEFEKIMQIISSKSEAPKGLDTMDGREQFIEHDVQTRSSRRYRQRCSS